MMLLASCGAYERLAILQDMKTDSLYVVQECQESKINVGDRLSITVTCSNPALAAPFNVIMGNTVYDPSTGEVNYRASTDANQGYLVDKFGDIDFPVLGKINVAGTTLTEVKTEIERRLMEKPYISDPLVFVKFQEFRVTMLGQVKNGNYVFNSGSVNILEAMAQVGGLSSDAVIDDVWVIRTSGGARKLYTLNLKSTDVYQSPAFYLQQNDVVYLKPKNNIRDTAINNRQQMFSNTVTLLSLLVSLTMMVIYSNR